SPRGLRQRTRKFCPTGKTVKPTDLFGRRTRRKFTSRHPRFRARTNYRLIRCSLSPANGYPWALVAERPIALPPAWQGRSCMARSPHILDLANEARNLAIVTRTREITQESSSILKQTCWPDTFLGRKTQEPFPQEKEKAD